LTNFVAKYKKNGKKRTYLRKNKTKEQSFSPSALVKPQINAKDLSDEERSEKEKSDKFSSSSDEDEDR